MGQHAVERRGFGLNVETIGAVHALAIGLAATTGLVHLYLFVEEGFLPFLLAGAGFFGAIGLLLVTRGVYRQLLYLAGIPYTLAQIGAYYAVEQPSSLAEVSTIALVDKVVQVLLIVVLAYLFYAEWDGF